MVRPARLVVRWGYLFSILLAVGCSLERHNVPEGTQRNVQQSKQQITTIVDIKGQTDTVGDLEALYLASGNWLGPTPSSKTRLLSFVCESKEARITRTDTTTVPFSSLKHAAFEWSPTRIDPVRTEVEKRDGTRLVLAYSDREYKWSLEEYDSQGKRRKASMPNSCWFSTGEDVQGVYLDLKSFSGQPTSGAKGKYQIPFREVRSIAIE